MNKWIAIIYLQMPVLILPHDADSEPRLGYVSFGPMLHWNSRNDEIKFSYGFEIAFWSYAKDPEGPGFFNGVQPDINKFGYGIDLGIEYEHGDLRLYAEPQLGRVFGGCSVGPLLEISKSAGTKSLGIQGSLWANLIGGVDLRYRHVAGKDIVAAGLNAKVGGLVLGRE